MLKVSFQKGSSCLRVKSCPVLPPVGSHSLPPTQIAPTCCLQPPPPVPHNLWPPTIKLTHTTLMITHPVATCPPPTPAQMKKNQSPTHTAVSVRLVAQGAGLGGCVGGLRGRNNRCRAGKAQVASIVVEALHLPFAGVWDGLALVYV